MNRIFKFRAWNCVENRMFDICSLDNTGSYERRWEVREDKVGSPYDINCIILQYTGIKDSNDKEIYEGDIVISNEQSGTFVVSWDEFSASFIVGNEPWPNAKLTIIGNIYQNSELIGK